MDHRAALAVPGTAGLALFVGAACYGISLLLDMQGLRLLGSAREAAVFATAPFVGAMLSAPLLGERPTAGTLGAGLAMAVGVALLLLATRHHVELEHDHGHIHDEHHRHEHG